MRRTTDRMTLTIAALWLLTAAPAEAEIHSSGDSPDREDLAPDSTDPNARYQHSRMGRTVDDWGHHLQDPDSEKRFEAVSLLEKSRDPKANSYLMEATSDSDARVATTAIDALGKLAVKEASEVLAEKLFLAGTSGALRHHVLVALGRIGDPAAAQRVLDFARGEPDPELRAVAIRVIGEIGDESVRDEAARSSESETDPKLKTIWQDAVAKISTRRASGRTVDGASPPR